MARVKPAWLTPVVEYGPIGVFFAAYYLSGLMAATAAIMAATSVGIAAAYYYERKVPMVPLITALVVLVFGGLTLYLNDETFIKMKPTIIQALFAVVLIGGLMFNKPLLKPLMKRAWNMTEQGWNILTFRFGLYFIAMAVLNELVWRTQSTDFWVNFKVFGPLGLMILFIMSQYPVIRRHSLPEEAVAPEDMIGREGESASQRNSQR